MDGVRFLQILLIFIPVGVAVYLIRLSKSLTLEKRLADFAITSVKDHDISFFDKFGFYVGKFVRLVAKGCKRSVLLRKYGLKYERFIPIDARNNKDGTYYVAIKILFSFVVLLLGIITLIIHFQEFDGMILLVILILAFFLPDIFLNIRFNQKRKRIEEDLLKAIIIMNNAFGSGKNIMQAIQIVKTELDGPIQDEFEKIYLDISYGLSLDVVFKRFYERVKIEDAKYITSSLTLLNKTGGDIIKVFSRLEKSILDKKNLRNELYSLTSSSRFVFRFLSILPFIFVLIIFLLNPSYFTPLFASPIGIMVFVFIIILYILYIIVIRRVLEVKI